MSQQPIKEFQGEYRWLSNFWPAKVFYNGIAYPTVENAYVAAKMVIPTDDLETCSPAQAKKMGKRDIKANWNEIKLEVMESLVRQKFGDYNPELRQKLIDTGDVELIEGNRWKDTFWGVYNGVGENHLGKIIMKIRNEIKNNG